MGCIRHKYKCLIIGIANSIIVYTMHSSRKDCLPSFNNIRKRKKAQIFVGVIIPGSTAFEDIEETVTRQLAPFGDDWKAEPYKFYLDKDSLSEITEEGPLSEEKLAKWYGKPISRDEHGFYYVTTNNPQAQWENWRIGGRWYGVVKQMALQNQDHDLNIKPEHQKLKNNMTRLEHVESLAQFFVLLTPDLHWYAIGTGLVMLEYSEQVINEWKIQSQKILEAHRHDILVGVNCHS